MVTAYSNGIIYSGQEIFYDKSLLVAEGKIAGIVNTDTLPPDIHQINIRHCFLAPGLIDLQVYGGGGYLFSAEPSAKALQAMGDDLVKNGTTGFLLTLATDSQEIMEKTIRLVRENPHPACLGLHFEGPYLNPEKKGAHAAQHIKKPTLAEVNKLIRLAGGLLKMMTLAPETCDPEIIQLLTGHGVVVSAGHSNANFDEAMTGFANGITAVTHLFNAMSSFHHRDTGLPGAVFMAENIPASIIADGIHVNYKTLSISKKLLKDRLFLITDAVAAVNEGAYTHRLKDDHFTLADGTLSGSNLTLLKAVRNCVLHAGIPLEEALRMASLYPARVIHANRMGTLETGGRANMIIFNNQFKLLHTVMDGNIFHGQPAEA